MSYASEKAAANRAMAARAKKYVYEPVLMDRTSGLALDPGTIVIKVQPFGCPKNGTMGQCYIGDAYSGNVISMVCENSLKPVKKAAKK